MDALSLQHDLDSLTDWTREWLLRLNACKCKIMYFGGSNESRMHYSMDDLVFGRRVELESSDCERNLGVMISSNLKWKNHISIIVSKANKVLGMLLKTFTSRDASLWRLLYVSLVRPHLEFASTVWNPYIKGDIEALERVQKRATKIPTTMRALDYEERLRVWDLTTLKDRRVRGDIIQIYKIRNGLEDIEWYTGPQYAPHSCTRDESQNRYRLVKEYFPARSRNDYCHFVSVRDGFFLNRAVDGWNGLSSSEIEAPSLNSFKARIDK